MKKVLLVAAMLLVAATAVGQEKRIPILRPVTASVVAKNLKLYDGYTIEVFSRQRDHLGKQVDIVQKGRATTRLFVDGVGVLRIHPCRNAVDYIRVEDWVILRDDVVRSGRDGRDGKDGRDGRPGRTVVTRAQPAPTTNVVNNNYNYSFGPAALPSYQLGGQYGPIVSSTQLASVSLVQPTRINICVSSTNVNSNANTIVSTNTNVLNNSSGNATGSATGSGSSTAGR